MRLKRNSVNLTTTPPTLKDNYSFKRVTSKSLRYNVGWRHHNAFKTDRRIVGQHEVSRCILLHASETSPSENAFPLSGRKNQSENLGVRILFSNLSFSRRGSSVTTGWIPSGSNGHNIFEGLTHTSSCFDV